MTARFRSLALSGLLLAATSGAVSLTPAPAQAAGGDKKEALRLYGDAKKKLAAEKYVDAAEGFEAANRVYTSANILFAAGQAWDAAGEPARAADAYAKALTIGDFKGDFDEKAREELGRLSKGLGSVKVDSKAGAVVRIDEHSEYTAPAMLFAKPGAHILHITRKDGSQELRKVEVTKGALLKEDADTPRVKKPEPEPAPAEKPEDRPEEPRPVSVSSDEAPPDDILKLTGFATAGLGVGVLGAGLFMGLQTSSAADSFNAGATQTAYDHANSMATTTNILLITGGVLTAAGAGLIVWTYLKPQESGGVALQVHPTGVSASGRF